MEVRRYREEDLGSLARLTVAAFGESVGFWEEFYDPEKYPRLDPEGVFVVQEDREVRATATILPLEVFVDGEPRPMGGISAVATHPAYRRRGYAGELMREVLRDMRGRGVHLSMLWPFAHAFYRAYGWELAGEAIAYSFKPTDLPTSPEQKLVRAYRDGDLPPMMALQEREAARHPLCVRRGEAFWRRILDRGGKLGERSPEVAVYEREGSVEGYVLYSMSGWREGVAPERTLKISEFIAGSVEAWDALISFSAAQDPRDFGIEHSTPRGEPLHPFLKNSHVQAKVEPEFMLRLVDVEGALGHLNRKLDAPLVLEVSDDVLLENTGEYTLGKSGVSRGAHSEHRAALDVRQLAQLYAGYLPVRRLAEHGLIETSSPEALERLDAMFPSGDPWVFGPDHF